MNIEIKDKVLERVILKMVDRSNTGIEKYGITLDDEEGSVLDFLIKTQSELMDAILYIQACREEIQDLTEEALIKDFEDADYLDFEILDDVSSTTIGNIVVNYELVDVKKERYGNRN